MQWERDDRIQREIQRLARRLSLNHIKPSQIHAFRTRGSKARAYARIWAFPKIFQEVLNVQPAYVIEVLSDKFDKLSDDNKTKVLIHELLHIPRNFSGSLLPHKSHGRQISREVERLYRMYKSR
jgi:predicted metallopeptidase